MRSGENVSNNSSTDTKEKDTQYRGEAGARRFRNNILLISILGVLFFGAVYWFDLNKSATRNSSLFHNPLGTNTPMQSNANQPGINQMPPVDNNNLSPIYINNISQIAAFAKQNVVNISVMKMTDPAGAGQQPKMGFTNPFSGNQLESIGSGIVVTHDGYVLTNFHVVENANDIVVTVFSGQGSVRHSAELIKLNEKLDLALIKITPKIGLFPAALGRDRKIQVAEDVIAIGSPFGLDQTVSKGIISAKNKTITIDKITHKNLLQTDAAINQGNSGGPLVDMGGYVIGVNTAIFTPTAAFVGIGFAVPISQAKKFMKDIIRLPRIMPNLNAHITKPQGQNMQQALPVAMNQANGMPVNMNQANGMPVAMNQANGMPVAMNANGMPVNRNQANGMPVAFFSRNTAPAISQGAVAPHGFRGNNCAECHQILPGNTAQPIAMTPQAGVVQAGLLTPRKTAPTIMQGAIAPHNDRGSNCSLCHEVMPANGMQPVAMMSGNNANAKNIAMPFNSRGTGNQFTVSPKMRGANNQRFSNNNLLNQRIQNQGIWLGAQQMNVTPQMQQKFNIDLPGGVLLTQVPVNTIADKAGLKAGDVIFKIDGRQVTNSKELLLLTNDFNGNVRFSILRDGIRENINVNFTRK